MRKPTTSQARYGHVAGSVGFIFIGALHTAVHFLELSGSELQERFSTFGTIRVSGQTSESWDLFQGTSILMGLFSLTIGCLSLAALRSTGQHQAPPIAVSLTNMAALVAIIAVGARHLGPVQIYGGLAGLCLFGLGVAANLRSTDPAPAL